MSSRVLPDLSEPIGSPPTRWSARRVLLATLAILGVVTGFALIYRFYMVVFLFFIAFSLKVAFEPAVNWLQRRGLRREVSLIFIYSLIAIVLLTLVWMLLPPLIEQAGIAASQLPDLYQMIRTFLIHQPIGLVRGVGLVMPPELSLPQLAILTMEGNPDQPVDPWAMPLTLVQVAFAFVSVFVMAYYWTIESELIIRRLLLQISAARREAVRTLIAEIQGKINGYFRGQLILCGVIGLLSTLAFFAIGVPNALLLGLLMALFESVPIAGPILGAIPAILMAASTAPEKVPWVIGAIVAIQVAESNLLVPRVMDRAVGVNAIVSLLAIAAFGALFGFAGALLAVPLAAVLQILFARLLFEPSQSEAQETMATDSAEAQRGRWAMMQFQTQELARDVRKLARADEEPPDPATIAVLDEVEAIAVRLNRYLANQENHA
ncbi:MAG: AI-2E family transporter [Caldilineaceae bacterium]|nr:AI-2E family transporter [Caldilineaceae bacterium]